MMENIKIWVKTNNSFLGKTLRGSFYLLKNIEMPVIPFFYNVLYKTHYLIVNIISKTTHFFYYKPMFKSQVGGSKKRMFLYSGVPQILGTLSISIGDDVKISGITTFCGRYSKKMLPELIIGNNVDIGWQNSFSIGKKIIIEDNVKLAGKVFLAGYPGHPINKEDRSENKQDLDSQIGDIILKEGSWIGTGVTILAGVKIGKGSIVGASSVVTKDVPDFVIVAGNPAKIVKKITRGNL